MDMSIVPYEGDSPMKPWPHLAAKAFCLKGSTPAEGSLFFLDSSLEETSLEETSPAWNPAGLSTAGRPVFVLIHGLGDEADTWRRLIPLLNARGYRVLALDLPGFGRSAAPHKISLKTHAAAVIKLLESACPGSPVILAGNSMGAVIAETVAFRKPELVRGLILIDGSIPGGPSNPGIFGLAKLLFSRKWYRSYRDDPDGAWASLYPYYADLDAMPQEDKEFLRGRVMERVESSTQEHAFFSTQRSLVGAFITAVSRYTSGIKSYKGKIQLIWGEKDRIVPLSSVNVFKTLRPDIALDVIPGAGHLPHQEKPEETARIMAGFAKSLSEV